MTGKMAFSQKGGDDGLRQFRPAAREDLADPFEPLNLRFGYHEVREPNAGKQNLAEGARIEHASVAIQALEGGQRAAAAASWPPLPAPSSTARTLPAATESPASLSDGSP